MTYIDYEFYALEYHGDVIPDEQSFKKTVIEATAFVDSFIINKEFVNIGDNLTKYRNAVCSVADEIYKQTTLDETPQKQSESVGNHSVSYSDSSKSYAERESIKYSKVRTHLAGTGLLYRGLG